MAPASGLRPQVQEDTSPHVTKQLDRKLGLLSVVSISVGAMLGSGIFVLPGLAASQAGPWVALSYLLAGLLVLPALLAKAELATAMPVSGGSYVYVDRALGPWVGTITGLGTWLALSAKTAFALVGLGAYMSLLVDVSESAKTGLAVVILVALLLLNAVGVSKAMALQTAIVGICLVALAWFGVKGGVNVQPDLLDPAFPTGMEGVLIGAGFVFVSYNGVTKVCSVAEEIKNPDRNIPLGMLIAQVTVMSLYVVVAFVIAGNVPWDQMGAEYTPVATAAGVFGGPLALKVMAVVAIMGLVSMCNAGIMATSRFPFAMSRDKLMPSVLGRVNRRFGTPIAAIALTGVLLLALLMFLPVTKLAKLASGFTIFIFMVVNVALMVLRETNPAWYKPSFRAPLYPLLPILGILGGFWLLNGLGGIAIAAVVGAMLFGTLWYFGYAKRRVTRGGAIRHLVGAAHTLKATQEFEEQEQATANEPRVLVPVWGSEPAAERLVRLAGGFVEEGLLEVVRLEEVPDQAGLSAFIEPDAAVDVLAERTLAIAKEMQVPVRFHDILTHNARQSLHDHAASTNTRWIVMEWPQARDLHTLVRNPLAWWVHNVPCDLGIFLDRGGSYDGETRDDYPHITVLVRDQGLQAPHLISVANRLAKDQFEGEILLLTSLMPGASAADLAHAQALHKTLGAQIDVPWKSRVLHDPDRIAAIVAATADTELLILDVSYERPLRALFQTSYESKVAEAVGCSVLKLKEHVD